MRHIICLAVGVMLGLSTTAIAQDGSEVAMTRTPANAQRFLVTMAPRALGGATWIYLRDGELRSPETCKTILPGRIGVWQQNQIVRASMMKVKRGVIGLNVDAKMKVVHIYPGEGAERAGIRVGDRLVAINGAPIATVADINSALSQQLQAGGPARVDYRRGSEVVSVSVDVLRAGDGSEFDVPVVESAPMNFEIDWSRVEKVSDGGVAMDGSSIIMLSIPNDKNGPYMTLYYSVAETRDRVLAAAQYLKDACDKSKDLGF